MSRWLTSSAPPLKGKDAALASFGGLHVGTLGGAAAISLGFAACGLCLLSGGMCDREGGAATCGAARLSFELIEEVGDFLDTVVDVGAVVREV